MERDCTEGCDGDHKHKWQITPHPHTDQADALVVDDDQEALKWLLAVAEQEWDDCEPGETRTITITRSAVKQNPKPKTSRSVDPFARNNKWATFTNDLSRNTLAQRHMDAPDFLVQLATEGVKDIDLAIIDPPYSPRQVAEHYRSIGLSASKADTQIAGLYARTRSALLPLLASHATVLSFGWNSAGMGKQHGFTIREVLLVAHGGAHNDTICIAETRS